jgi:hypothetical protein
MEEKMWLTKRAVREWRIAAVESKRERAKDVERSEPERQLEEVWTVAPRAEWLLELNGSSS